MNGKSDSTTRERELQYEVERLRDMNEREREKAEQAARARRQERYAEMEQSRRMATTWPEALHKQHALFMREAREENDEDEGQDKYFTIGVEALDKALELWNEITATRYDELSALDRRIAQINDEIRFEVARRLQLTSDKSVYQDFAQSIREDELESFLNW
jgi:hypothetical protein